MIDPSRGALTTFYRVFQGVCVHDVSKWLGISHGRIPDGEEFSAFRAVASQHFLFQVTTKSQLDVGLTFNIVQILLLHPDLVSA